MLWGCLIFPFLCRYGHEGNIHLLGSWPHRTYLYSDGTQTMTFGLGRGSICSAGSHPRHHVQAFRASDLSPFIVVSAVKISITSSLSFYSLASFPASPSLLIILGSTHSHTQTNLHHPPTLRSFLCPSSSNETFSWAMIDLYLLSRPIILGEGISTRSERNGETVFRHPPPPCPIFLYSEYTHYT